MACIYKLWFNNKEKFYVGSAVNFKRRVSKHKYHLKKGDHINIHLQRSWNKYQIINFEVIEECALETLLEREQYYLDTLKPELNICKLVVNNKLGTKASDETKQKMSLAFRKAWTEERRMRQSILLKGKPHAINPNKKPSIKSEEGLKISIEKRRNHPSISKLNVDKVKDIKYMLEAGKSLIFCAKKYNVAPQTINSIRRGDTWKDIII